jgi:hypothetical protein
VVVGGDGDEAAPAPRLALAAPGSPFGAAAGVELEVPGRDEAALFWGVVRDLVAGTHAGCK